MGLKTDNPEKYERWRKVDGAYRQRNRDKVREYWRQYRMADPDRWAANGHKSNVKTKYGLTVEEFERLRQQPCEICGRYLDQAFGRKSNGMVIDHHIRGNYDGVLCHHCNTAIGHLGHDVSRILAAAEYVKRTRGLE